MIGLDLIKSFGANQDVNQMLIMVAVATIHMV